MDTLTPKTLEILGHCGAQSTSSAQRVEVTEAATEGYGRRVTCATCPLGISECQGFRTAPFTVADIALKMDLGKAESCKFFMGY